MRKKTPAAGKEKWFRGTYQHDSAAEVLAHLRHECERTGYELSGAQQVSINDLEDAPDESAIARLHAWWCYDFEKLVPQMSYGFHPKPRIYLSIWMSRRGAFIVSWRPTILVNGNLTESDFRTDPCIPHSKENRLIAIRDLRAASVFHEPPNSERPWTVTRPAHVSDNDLASDGLLLQAAGAIVKELKQRLSYCFSVTMIDDIYVEWQSDPDQKWDFRGKVKFWEIRNVAEYERREALKVLDAFEKSYGCSLPQFIDVVFAPAEKHRTGPAPLAHTKIDRCARRFKTLGCPKLTRSVVMRYVALLKEYRPDLLPPSDRPSTNVVPFNSKK